MVHEGGKWESRGFRDVFTALMGLSMTQGLDLGTTLIFTGAYNVVTGFRLGSHAVAADEDDYGRWRCQRNR